jgi:hypothetical protein
MKNKIDYTSTFKSIMNDAEKFNEHNDCAVKAVAIATGADYGTVHGIMKSFGRRNRTGTNMHSVTAPTLKKLGFKMVKVPLIDFTSRYHGKWSESKTITTKHPRRFPLVWGKGVYLLRTARHILPCVSGTVHDWTQERSLRVREVYRVEKLDNGFSVPTPERPKAVGTAARLVALSGSYVTVVTDAADNPATRFRIKGKLEIVGDHVRIAVGTEGILRFRFGQVTRLDTPVHGEALITVR